MAHSPLPGPHSPGLRPGLSQEAAGTEELQQWGSLCLPGCGNFESSLIPMHTHTHGQHMQGSGRGVVGMALSGREYDQDQLPKR